jgi:cytoskeletal protein CcmA (bactofilin family)
MDPAEKKTEQPASDTTDQKATPTLPEDALEKSNQDLANENVIDATHSTTDGASGEDKPIKPPSGIKHLLRKIDIYLIGTILLIVIAAGFLAVSYLNSKKPPKPTTVNSTSLSPNALKAVAGSNVTINNSSQTLTIQGSAIFSGQVLMRGNLSVAGNIQVGGGLTVATLTVTNSANIASAQINSLQVAKGLVVQGTTNLTSLTVSAASTFNQPITASQITVTNLILSGNATLTVPDHLSFPGPTPSRTYNAGILGSGGSASVTGSDTSGVINVNTGNGPSAGCFITVSFAQKFANLPKVIIGPVDAGAGQSGYYITKTINSFTVCMSSPPANQVFEFDYFVSG